MTIPDYQTAMLPVLKCLADGSVRSSAEIREYVAAHFSLPDSELRELVPSGQKTLFADRVSWAQTYMRKAGLIDSPKRGSHVITHRGKEILAANPARIDNEVLGQFPEFDEWRARSAAVRTRPSRPVDLSTETPEESLETAYEDLRGTVEADLVERVLAMSPDFFERLVVQLLVAMRYGGSLKDAGEAIGRSGDGGIDGIIKEDRLGLDVIHVQAKRWKDGRTVGRPQNQAFAGSLDGVGARKGVFITTSAFSREARAYTERINKRIVLIDGQLLASLMYEHGIGVTPVASYDVSRVDGDYFVED